jgi:hypothetical protein
MAMSVEIVHLMKLQNLLDPLTTLEQAAEYQVSWSGCEWRRVSPAVLLAVLVVSERYSGRILLGEATIPKT